MSIFVQEYNHYKKPIQKQKLIRREMMPGRIYNTSTLSDFQHTTDPRIHVKRHAAEWLTQPISSTGVEWLKMAEGFRASGASLKAFLDNYFFIIKSKFKLLKLYFSKLSKFRSRLGKRMGWIINPICLLCLFLSRKRLIIKLQLSYL